ncbi:HAMP domain-containing histidine kinase [Mucilaginibacter mali]|uniref:histidine kinase n=1 Tax=Mucilaginibacter mali TaxID=2740462 RepID=A0A7D4UCX7_9SPHI|nr:HAMP domain-containing sensor histidine kinase [Mucilaginibacter mali]QKJ32078.1 HAMP domain-containing histidine kinase [Mucilaginibacter mali]
MLKKLHDLWLRLIGQPPDFSLESRIYHSISIGVMVLAVFYIPYNIFAGLYVAAFSCVFLSLLFGYQYYRSRMHRHAPSTTLFALTGIFVFSVNYFANSGIHGSTDIIWPSYLLLVFAISPYRQHALWLVVYVVAFIILHLVAYQYPHLVKYPFNIGKGQLIDRLTAFPLPVVAIYIIIKFIRRSYDKERVAAEEKAVAIEARNQQILLQTHQLEQSNAEKNKLMSIISHDMRAPLTHIQGYLELLNSHALESHERPMLEQQLLTATNSTLEMLTNLLQWSRAQMEGSGVHLSAINLLNAIQGTLEMGKTQALKKEISFNYHIDAAITVIADVDMLQLVVRNLVSNAIKFTPIGGIINIDARMVQNECKITVADNGKGIDREKQGKIFSINTEPAFGTNNEKGVGLGLLLCKEFIERQGGRIGFESVFGHGSSFFIYIPLQTNI